MKSKRIVLVYPRLGPYDFVIKDLPLSLLYVARGPLEKGYEVVVIDQRVCKDWKRRLSEELKEAPLLVGVSVMTGRPIHYALEVSRFVRENSSVPIVWGGVHPSIMPEQTLQDKDIDIVVKGEGESILAELCDSLYGGSKPLEEVRGLAFRTSQGKIVNNPMPERIPGNIFSLPPYHLVDFGDYYRFTADEKVFSITTTSGCPHRCAFCYSPSFNKGKWSAEPIENSMEHIKFIMQKYRPDYLSFIDSDFFVDLGRADRFFKAIKDNNIRVVMGFRGVRIDELKRMDESLLKLMEEVGVKHLHIGAESGSQKILELMLKGIKVEDIVDVNRKLTKFPGILPTYNFFSGLPGEIKEDVKKSTDLIIRLLKENQYCQITAYNQFTPYPGTELFALAVKHGLQEPKSLREWVEYDEGDFARKAPWLNGDMKRILDMLYFTSIFVDNKITAHFTGKGLVNRSFRIASVLYRPIARYRMKNHYCGLFLEKTARDIAKSFMEKR
jgi:anaerobic magnesium-protoporphyrin IX monomethyl ester cyclase